MVAVWHALDLVEVVQDVLLVGIENFLVLFSEWKVTNSETGFFSELNPIVELVSLDSISWPVPSGLRFDNVEFFNAILFDPHGHGAMVNVTAGSVELHWSLTIESENGEEITRLDESLVWNNLVDLSLLNLPSDGPVKELDGSLSHVLWHLWLEELDLSMEASATSESLNGMEDTEHLLLVR